MEEKERYEVIYNEDELGYCIIDNEEDLSDDMHSFNIIADLLNQQDRRIKELEEENKVRDFWRSAYKAKQLEYDQVYAELRNAYEKNQQLKEENGYIIFSDGYDENDNPIHKQEFVTYKDKCSELIKENKKLKQSQKHLVKAVLDEVYNELICRFAYFVDNYDSAKIDIDAEEFVNILVKIEKKYKGE